MKSVIEWNEIQYRKPTIEEKEEFEREHGFECEFYLECKLPDDGQEVLISTKYGTEIDTYYCDDGCYFENTDIEEVFAWAEIPKYENNKCKENYENKDLALECKKYMIWRRENIPEILAEW